MFWSPWGYLSGLHPETLWQRDCNDWKRKAPCVMIQILYKRWKFNLVIFADHYEVINISPIESDFWSKGNRWSHDTFFLQQPHVKVSETGTEDMYIYPFCFYLSLLAPTFRKKFSLQWTRHYYLYIFFFYTCVFLTEILFYYYFMCVILKFFSSPHEGGIGWLPKCLECILPRLL